MGQHILQGNPPIAVTLRKSARAKRISLRVSQLDGRVTLTLPHFTPDDEALGFLHEKEDWVRGHLERRHVDEIIALGSTIPVEGKMRRIESGTGRLPRLTEETLYVPGAEARVPAKVQAFLKTFARARLTQACDHYAARLGKPFSRLTLRDTRSRWGSCSSAGALMFSWRLCLAPPEVLRYVAAHEVAHLQEMNHSSAFWHLVTQLYGPYDEERSWLRRHGAELHRYKFR